MRKIYLIGLGLTFLFTSSCKKFVSGEDVSPNAASKSTPALLLSASELGVFSLYGGSISRNSSLWCQQSAGCIFESEKFDAYQMDEGDVVHEWRQVYETLKNLKKLEALAGNVNPNYQGISKVLSAAVLGLATDFWGDIPWSDALKGEEQQYGASYDKQEDIINAIQTMLSESIALLRNSSNLLSVATEDFIYHGDMQKWVGYAYLLKARYAMRVSKRVANWHVDALRFSDSALANGFVSSAADANCIFGNGKNEYNQWYAFTKVERKGYMYAGKIFVDAMKAQNDPRLAAYFTLNDSGSYAGSALGSSNDKNVSNIGSYFASANSITPLATYVELLFIKAEAYFAAGLTTSAATSFNNAVQAHVLEITGTAAPIGFVGTVASENAGTISLNKIMLQKYISGYTMLEPYNDWRRTNIPSLNKNPKATLSGIARRYPSSMEERQYNTKAGMLYGITDLDQKVWWDQ